MRFVALALYVNIKSIEDKHLTSSLIRLECPLTEPRGQPVLGEMKENERNEPLEAGGGTRPCDVSSASSQVSPGPVRHHIPIRQVPRPPPVWGKSFCSLSSENCRYFPPSWSHRKPGSLGTRKSPNPSDVEKTSHEQFSFRNFSSMDKQIKW